MKTVRSPIGQLLDTGNIMIYGDNVSHVNPISQSFDFMTDTLLPGMKLGWNWVTGTERYLTSWKFRDEPALGDYSLKVDTRGYPQMILWDVEKIKFRGGPWDGFRFSGDPDLKPNLIYNFTFVVNQREIYYQYNLIDTSFITRLVLQPSGNIECLLWVDSIQDWSLYLALEGDYRDRYAVCKAFGSCNIDNSSVCECLKGFEPTSPEQWRVAIWSQGCRRTTPLDFGPGEGFNKHINMKLPDTLGSWYNQTMTLVECENMCKSNCSCTAYTNLNTSGTGSGCLLWFGDLTDIKTIAETGDSLYIRMPPSELDLVENSRSSNAGRRVRIIVPISIVALAILVSLCLFYRFRTRIRENRSGDEDLELPLFCLSTLLTATNNFSMDNKLGEGGFGPVYKVFYDSMTAM
ncbi:putative non-specific serine/threonine protein kinase [Helianthus debilis subsp. tardiflorus]